MAIYLLAPASAFSQSIDITGTWKQPRAIHVRHYTFLSNGLFNHDEYGDLSEYHFTGRYYVSNDSIFITYDSTLTVQMKKIRPADDTLYIVNKHTIRVNPYVIVFNEDISNSQLTIVNNELLNYKIKNFADTFYLQHYLFNKWVNIDTFITSGKDFLLIENYPLPLHSGKNIFRIKSSYSRAYMKAFEVQSSLKKVVLTRKKKSDILTFSRVTYYELYHSNGTLIRSGNADQLDLKDLEPGNYFLSYDNTYKEVVKKSREIEQ